MNAARAVAVDAAPGVRRLTAPNPSPMTADGTNTYLVGDRSVAVIDPGPDVAEHRAAILDAVGVSARIQAILITHAHLDHSAGAAELAQASGAPVYAFGRFGDGRSARMTALVDAAARQNAASGGGDPRLGGGEGGDRAFMPDHRLSDGAVLVGGDEPWRIETLHCPGHTSDHLVFALAIDDAPSSLFSGDLVMGWATSLVSPPDGDMGAFLRSLERLGARHDPMYLPGHGPAIADPAARVAELYAHRRGREAQILAALVAGPADPAALVAQLYSDVPAHLHGMAARNVLAHLIDLWERGAAAPVGPFSATAVFERIGG